MTTANIVTLFRIALIPVFGLAWWSGRPMLALILFIVAALTDSLDGFIARAFNQISPLGQVLDPAADKLMLFTCFLVAAVRHVIPVWLVALVIGRDLLLGLGTFIFAFVLRVRISADRWPPTRVGKYATFCEILTVGCALGWEIIGGDLVRSFVGAMVLLSAVLTTLSAIQYASRAARAFKTTQKESHV